MRKKIMTMTMLGLCMSMLGGCGFYIGTKPKNTQQTQTNQQTNQGQQRQSPSTQAPSTQAPQTQVPSTQAPSTQAPSTQAPATETPSTEAQNNASSSLFYYMDQVTQVKVEKYVGGSNMGEAFLGKDDSGYQTYATAISNLLPESAIDFSLGQDKFGYLYDVSDGYNIVCYDSNEVVAYIMVDSNGNGYYMSAKDGDADILNNNDCFPISTSAAKEIYAEAESDYNVWKE